MRYCRFLTESGPHYGEVKNRAGNEWIERLIAPPEEDLAAALSAAAFDPVPLAHARLLVPVTPSKIVCVGRNYRDHPRNWGMKSPKSRCSFSSRRLR